MHRATEKFFGRNVRKEKIREIHNNLLEFYVALGEFFVVLRNFHHNNTTREREEEEGREKSH